MEKAAEVYTRLKSRVLGPKIEAIQKANKTGTEKEKAEVEKAEEKLAGEEAPKEKVEEEPSTGEGWAGPLSLGLLARGAVLAGRLGWEPALPSSPDCLEWCVPVGGVYRPGSVLAQLAKGVLALLSARQAGCRVQVALMGWQCLL